MADDYDVDVAQEADYLRITLSGERSFLRSERVLHFVVTEARAHGAQRVLLDTTRLTGDLSLTYGYTLGEQLAQLFGGTGIRLAVSSAPHGVSLFTATIARGQGADFAVFYTEPEALAWLLKPTDL